MKPVRLFMCLSLIFSIVVCCSACGHEPEGPEDQIIYYNIDSEPVTLDPQIANDSASRLVIMNIFEGLVRLDKNNDPSPGAAESWDISGDHTTYTFHLRKGLKWNDGSALSAGDFVYGIKRALDPETYSPTASTLFAIKNAQEYNSGSKGEDELGLLAINDSTLEIQLAYPDSDFLRVLSTPPAMPCSKSFFTKAAGQYGRTDEMLLSNGAFYVREDGWAHDEYIYIRKNTNYVGKDKPVPAGVNISIGKSFGDLCSAIDSGEIDCAGISAADEDNARRLGLQLTSFGDTVWGLAFNSKNEILSSLKIRQSLISVIDRQKVLKKLPDTCSKTINLIPDGAELEGKNYRKEVGDVTAKLPDDPRKLLKKAEKELELESVPSFTILCTDDEATQSYVNGIIESWNALTGSYCNKNPMPLSELKDRVESGRFEVVAVPLTINGETPLATLELFESSSSYNAAALSDEEYDRMIKDIRRNLTLESISDVKKAERYIIDNAYFLPLYTENRYYASSPDVRNIIFHPYGAEADFFYAEKTVE